jgi:hypothetical protein
MLRNLLKNLSYGYYTNSLLPLAPECDMMACGSDRYLNHA